MEVFKTYDIPTVSDETEFHSGFILTQNQEGDVQFHYLYLDISLYAILIKGNEYPFSKPGRLYFQNNILPTKSCPNRKFPAVKTKRNQTLSHLIFSQVALI